MSEYESDLDSIPQEPPKKIAITDKEKKWTTKMMIKDALTELKTRKGVSVYAIKKHLTDKFQVDTDRLSYVIKKTLKTGVEDGTFVQLKGIGASGSFKLAVVKEKVKKTIKKKKPEKSGKESKDLKKKLEKTDKSHQKPDKQPAAKTTQKNLEKPTNEVKKMKEKNKEKADDEKVKKAKVKKTEPVEKVANVKKPKQKKVGSDTPAKKRASMMKRKSIGSIRKPPKMKPK